MRRMSEVISPIHSKSRARQFVSAQPLRSLRLGGKSLEASGFSAETLGPQRWHRESFESVIRGITRRWRREQRRRKVGRAYDMALEIARVLPHGSEVLDVGCGNGFIAHHLSAMLGTSVMGIDLARKVEAPIGYRRYDGARFPASDQSFDAVTLCYVLHHAQDVCVLPATAAMMVGSIYGYSCPPGSTACKSV
jgi:Methyltransferase domain